MNDSSPELHKGLTPRHLTMITIGGVIGAGLFVGSGVVIADTGPLAFLSYALCGVLIVMVMRMLGEMAVANPSTGSFSDYAREALGGWAGFSTAWLYWYFWVVVVGIEAVAGADVIRYWFPDVPLATMSLILLALMTATNLMSVTSFGVFEYWFASIKVFAIIAFLVLGSLYVLGIPGEEGPDFSNLYEHGGMLPNGIGAIFAGIVVVIFSMVGAEIATIAAAESEDPGKAIVKATNSVIFRILVFFVGSVFLIAVIVPWNSESLAVSPFVTAFEVIGIPGADHIMNAVVLTAVLSCLNSGLYTASRMLYVLAGRKEAPGGMNNVNRRGVPTMAILTSTVVGVVCVAAAYVSPERIYHFLLNSTGATILFVYLLICFSQIVLRKRADPDKLVVKMWGFPWLSIATIVGMVLILISMGLNEDTLPQLVLSLFAWGVILVAYWLLPSRRRPAAQVEPEPAELLRVLIVANQTLGAAELLNEVRQVHGTSKAMFFVCVPAEPARGAGEEADAELASRYMRAGARARLEVTLEVLAAEGVLAEGAVGDYRPLVAVDEAVRRWAPDSIIIATHPHEHSNWLQQDIVSKVREHHSLPVHHVVTRAPTVFYGP